MTPEGKVKERVKKFLREHNAYWFCPVQNGMGAPALDFMQVQVPGVSAFVIETKAPGKKVTVRQARTIAQIRAAGGTVFIIDGDIQEMEQWINMSLTRSRRPW
jgi:hypothetical protein